MSLRRVEYPAFVIVRPAAQVILTGFEGGIEGCIHSRFMGLVFGRLWFSIRSMALHVNLVCSLHDHSHIISHVDVYCDSHTHLAALQPSWRTKVDTSLYGIRLPSHRSNSVPLRTPSVEKGDEGRVGEWLIKISEEHRQERGKDGKDAALILGQREKGRVRSRVIR